MFEVHLKQGANFWVMSIICVDLADLNVARIQILDHRIRNIEVIIRVTQQVTKHFSGVSQPERGQINRFMSNASKVLCLCGWVTGPSPVMKITPPRG